MKSEVLAQFVGASLRGRPLFACDVRRPGAHGGTPLQIRPLRRTRIRLCLKNGERCIRSCDA